MATSRKSDSSSKNDKSTKSGSTRRSPGSGGQGAYYHIELRPNEDFATFRTQDIGDPGHIQRVAGKREGGSWATVKWLVAKEDAHVEGDTLVGDTQEVRDLFKRLRSRPTHKTGDRFEAKARTRSTGGQKKTGSAKTGKSRTSQSKSRK